MAEECYVYKWMNSSVFFLVCSGCVDIKVLSDCFIRLYILVGWSFYKAHWPLHSHSSSSSLGPEKFLGMNTTTTRNRFVKQRFLFFHAYAFSTRFPKPVRVCGIKNGVRTCLDGLSDCIVVKRRRRFRSMMVAIVGTFRKARKGMNRSCVCETASAEPGTKIRRAHVQLFSKK